MSSVVPAHIPDGRIYVRTILYVPRSYFDLATIIDLDASVTVLFSFRTPIYIGTSLLCCPKVESYFPP